MYVRNVSSCQVQIKMARENEICPLEYVEQFNSLVINQVNIFVTTVIPGKVILLVILGMDMLPDSPNPDLISDPNVLLSTAVSSCGRLANPLRFVVAYFNFSSEPKSNIVEILQKILFE